MLLAVLLLVSSLPLLPPVAASDPLVADAGTSRFVPTGSALDVAGAAHFGTPPYAYAWSHGGDASRFADAASAATSFDTAGLPAGDVVLTLTVTDAAGGVASDTVRHRLDAGGVLLDVTGFAPFGTPIVQPVIQHAFPVPPGISRATGVLDWDNFANDLDLVLLDAAGAAATGAQGQTFNKPERVAVANPAPGTWQAEIQPWLSAPETYRLRIEGAGPNPLPVVAARGPWAFGALDAQTMEAAAAGGTEPYAFAWDLDGDGHAETAGQTATAALPAGTHAVRVRLTDAAGYEVESAADVTVSTADHVLRFQCGGDPRARWMMEFTSTRNTCWVHGGHHTYFTESTLYALRRVTGFVFSVEQQFAWPSEFAIEEPTEAPIVVEISRDGEDFRGVGHASYKLVETPLEGDLDVPTRQGLTFEFDVDGLGKQFRFLRLREPKSVTHGLSGYLDNSNLFVHVDVVRAVTPKGLAPATRDLSCAEGHILEDFFPEHPCTFGGVDRYDAPSFWHTYYIGEGATLDRVRGAFLLAPWRTDDWNQGRPPAWAANTSAFVQTSVDGIQWRDVAVVPATLGAPTAFDVPLDGSGARFVRLFPEYHARFDQMAEFAPNHHPRAYFLGSNVTVEGVLPGA